MYTALAVERFADVFRPGRTVVWGGDGWGTIGGIFDYYDNFQRRGLSLLWGDLYRSETLGAGLSDIATPSSPLWRDFYILLSHLLQPNDVYTATGMIGLVLIGYTSYLLARELGAGAVLAFVFGLMLGLTGNYHGRLSGGHLTFATYFMPIAVMWLSWRVARQPTLSRMLQLALATWLNFLLSEYFGFHGLFISATLLLVATPLLHRLSLRGMLAGAERTTMSGAVFVLLMCLSYPTMVWGRMLSLLGLARGSEDPFGQGMAEVLAYTVRRLDPMFTPTAGWVQAIAPARFLNPKVPPEFDFQTGYVALLVIAIGVPILLAQLFDRTRASCARLLAKAAIAFAAVFAVAFLLAADPRGRPSLVLWVSGVTTVFRVNTRALLYAQLAVFVLALIALVAISRWRPALPFWSCIEARRWGRAAAHGLLAVTVALLAVVLVWDVTPWPDLAIRRIRPYPLPRQAVYEALARQERGLVLELPFHMHGVDPPESDYVYILGRRIHGMPILNGLSFRGNGFLFHVARDQMDINRNVERYLDDLAAAGVRYLIAHGPMRANLAQLAQSPKLETLFDSAEDTLYRIKGYAPIDKALLLSRVFALRVEVESLPTQLANGARVQLAVHPDSSDRKVRSVSLARLEEPVVLSDGPPFELFPGRYQALFEIGGSSAASGDQDLVELAVSVTGAGAGATRGLRPDEISAEKLGTFAVDFACEGPCRVAPRIRVLGAGEIVQGTIFLWRVGAAPGAP